MPFYTIFDPLIIAPDLMYYEKAGQRQANLRNKYMAMPNIVQLFAEIFDQAVIRLPDAMRRAARGQSQEDSQLAVSGMGSQ